MNCLPHFLLQQSNVRMSTDRIISESRPHKTRQQVRVTSHYLAIDYPDRLKVFQYRLSSARMHVIPTNGQICNNLAPSPHNQRGEPARTNSVFQPKLF